MTLRELNNKIQEEVSNSEYGDKRLIFGEGNENEPVIMLIGEAPGGKEEELGRPFVGSAGKNLDEFLKAVDLKREEIYIGNAVKIRTTKLSPKTNKVVNRTPNTKEINFFNPYLLKEIEILRPKIVATLGNTALNAVMTEGASIGDCHGTAIAHKDYFIFPLYHPAAVIYNRSLKDIYYEDLRKLKAFADSKK